MQESLQEHVDAVENENTQDGPIHNPGLLYEGDPVPSGASCASMAQWPHCQAVC